MIQFLIHRTYIIMPEFSESIHILSGGNMLERSLSFDDYISWNIIRRTHFLNSVIIAFLAKVRDSSNSSL